MPPPQPSSVFRYSVQGLWFVEPFVNKVGFLREQVAKREQRAFSVVADRPHRLQISGTDTSEFDLKIDHFRFESGKAGDESAYPGLDPRSFSLEFEVESVRSLNFKPMVTNGTERGRNTRLDRRRPAAFAVGLGTAKGGKQMILCFQQGVLRAVRSTDRGALRPSHF